MPILEDGRWEKYAQLLAAGEMSDVDAHEAAGFKRNRGNANRLKANEDIRKRVEELKEAAAKKAVITREHILRRIERLADKAEEAGQFTPSLNALVKLGEEALGMFVSRTKNEHTFSGDPADLDRDKLLAIAKKANGHASRTN